MGAQLKLSISNLRDHLRSHSVIGAQTHAIVLRCGNVGFSNRVGCGVRLGDKREITAQEGCLPCATGLRREV